MMPATFKRIILVTDTSKNSAAAGQTALELAKHHSASLLIVDTMRRPSLVSQWFSGNSEEFFEVVANQKQERLDKFADPFHKAGLDVETRLLIGNSSESVARASIEENANLVIRYMKGVNSRVAGPFGNTARNLMRVCPCPLLLVARDRPFSNPRVLACVNAEHGQSENETIIGESRKLAGDDGPWDLLYCWEFYGNEYMAGYVGDELMRQYMSDSERNFLNVFTNFLSENELSIDDPGVHMEQGDPVKLIPEYCLQKSVDVVVMSSASLNHPLHRLLGSTVESVLDEIPCSLLIVKPAGFKSPVKASRSTVETRQ